MICRMFCLGGRNVLLHYFIGGQAVGGRGRMFRLDGGRMFCLREAVS